MDSAVTSIQQVEPLPDDMEDLIDTHTVEDKLFTKPFCNVLVSALVLSLTYSAIFPGGGLLEIVITDGMNSTDSPVGFLSQSLMAFSTIPTALAAPFVINTIGARATLGLSTLLTSGLFIGILFMRTWLIYLGAIIAGFGTGLLWVIVLKISTDNSTSRNIQRNNTIFWCIFMMSMVLGNTADYFYLGNLETIDSKTRFWIYMICCIFVVAACLVGVLGYRNLIEAPEFSDEIGSYLASQSIDLDSQERVRGGTVLEKLKRSAGRYRVTLLRREVGLLFTLLIYIACVQTFYALTFQTCIGNTFSDRNVIPLMGLVLGVTEVLFCPIFGLICKKMSNKVIVIFLFLSAVTSFYLTFLIFPPTATFKKGSNDPTFIKPQKFLVLVIAVLIGVSDCGFNIIMNSIIGLLFRADSEIGFMLLNTTMTTTNAIVFLISPHVSLYYILGAEAILCTLATVCVTMDLFKTGK